MSNTVFYAWQSDLPNNTNRGFIRDALERALKQLNATLNVEAALRPDQDTENVPGSPTVADTIFEKIDSCRIFLPDISIVTPKGAPRPIPNPNVMIEYGRATHSLGDDRIVPVFNAAYGRWETDRPFDMRHKRRPVTYHLPENHSPEEKKAARDDLIEQLVRAISLILTYARSIPAKLPDDEAFASFRKRYQEVKPDSGGKTIGFWCAAIPVSQQINIPRPFEFADAFERSASVSGTFSGNRGQLVLTTMDSGASGINEGSSIQPRQAAAERQWLHQILGQRKPGRYARSVLAEDICIFRIQRDGSLFCAVKSDHLDEGPMMFAKWIVADVANVLKNLHQLRDQVEGAKDAIYAIMVEVRYDENDGASWVPASWKWGLLADEWPHASRTVTDNPIKFGPMRIGQKSQFGNDLDNLLAEIHMAAGARPVDGFHIMIE